MNTNHQPPIANHYIDTHAHLDSYSDVKAVIDRAQKAGVTKMVIVSFDVHCARFNSNVAKKGAGLFTGVGIHPHNTRDLDKQAKEELTSLAKEPLVRAIGETGLDFHYFYSEEKQQREAFKWHIELASKLKLPVTIHSREAMEEALEILSSEGWPQAGFVFHAFSGSLEQAHRIFNAGGLVSITGVVTFNNALALQELVKQIDLEKIMLETDSPYLTPEPFRGKTNEPANVKLVAEKIAELKGISLEEVADKTTKNAEKFFGI